MDVAEEELMISKEVCKYLKISKVTLYSLQKKIDAFPKPMIIGNKKRWRRSEIEAYLESTRRG